MRKCKLKSSIKAKWWMICFGTFVVNSYLVSFPVAFPDKWRFLNSAPGRGKCEKLLKGLEICLHSKRSAFKNLKIQNCCIFKIVNLEYFENLCKILIVFL